MAQAVISISENRKLAVLMRAGDCAAANCDGRKPASRARVSSCTAMRRVDSDCAAGEVTYQPSFVTRCGRATWWH
jgi:hypothetical protein